MNTHSVILAVACVGMLLVGTLNCGADSVYALRGEERVRLEVPAQFYPPTGDEYNGYAAERGGEERC